MAGRAKAGRRRSDVALRALRRGWSNGLRVIRNRGPGQVQFWFIALIVGILAGSAAIGFRLGISWLQSAVYGTDDILTLHSHAAALSWVWIVAIPVLGGLAVGLLLHHFTDDGRVRSVAEVIEGAALREGRVERRRGLVSALASLITLSTGGSTGREGPVVHLAGVIASYVNAWIRADGVTGRDLLGCAVAAAVSASFNAPIAGALFALEVVLRHFAVHAFAPIAIASVAGTVLGRLVFGDGTEFSLTLQGATAFYPELPAFMLLGLLAGLVAVVLMRSVFWAEDIANATQAALRLPGWARPMVSGAILGGIAVWFPHVIGVGYETTSRALTGQILLHEAVVLVMLKVVAVAITIAGRMGGGIFSPALMVGALTGIAFGAVATAIFPDLSGGGAIYALAGMGAVAAAVLGAPVSTTMIVFELTGDWQTGIAVMTAVSLSSALASRMVKHSYFLTQLDRRGVRLATGPQGWLPATIRVEAAMRGPDHPAAAPEDVARRLIGEGVYLQPRDTLDRALPLIEHTAAGFVPVVRFPGGDTPPELIGSLHHVDALKAINRALIDTAREEHS